jgi:hypothetical protein
MCYSPCPVDGRRPEGLASQRFEGPNEAAVFLAQTAYLEAAAVDAFERLTRELEAHGAPKRLRAASRRAARDEMRHATVTKRLAEQAGGTVPPCHVAPGSVRSLEEMAIENAIEGCVRETYGAAFAAIQAAQARDAGVRKAMKRIAREETAHAQLSWSVARWLDTRLDAGARGRVRQAQARAVEALVREAACEPDASLTERLGVPTVHQARAALSELRDSLWTPSLAA